MTRPLVMTFGRPRSDGVYVGMGAAGGVRVRYEIARWHPIPPLTKLKEPWGLMTYVGEARDYPDRPIVTVKHFTAKAKAMKYARADFRRRQILRRVK